MALPGRVLPKHQLGRCRFLAALAAIMVMNPAAPCAAPERIVNVYNWSDYIAPKIIEVFTKETGSKGRYDTFDSNDTLEAKLLAGRSGYDVVVPTGYFLELHVKAGVFQKAVKQHVRNRSE